MKETIKSMLLRLQEAGRVLSGKNEKAVKACIAALQSMLDQLGGDTAVTEANLDAVSLALTEARVDGSIEDLQARLRAAVEKKFTQPGGKWSAWIFATFPDYVVVKDDSSGSVKYFQVPFTDDGTTVTLGDSTEVAYKQTFEKIAEAVAALIAEAERPEQPSRELNLFEAVECELIEALDKEGWVWRTRLIESGRSKNGRYYPPQVLAEAAPLFEGAKAYDGHLSETEEAASSVRRRIGTHRNVKAVTSGAKTCLESELHIWRNAGWLREAVLAAKEAGEKIGTSIKAKGRGRIGRADGLPSWIVEKITKVGSADVVESPAAGGHIIELVASEQKGDEMAEITEALKDLTADELKEARPDLFTEEEEVKETTPAQSEGGNSDAKFSETITSLTERLEAIESEKLVSAKIAEANLPESWKTRVAARFAGRKATAEDLDAAIKEAQQMWAEVAPVKITEAGAVEVADEDFDRKKAAMLGLFMGEAQKLGEAKVPAYNSIHAAFVDLTGRTPYSPGTTDFNRQILAESAQAVAGIDSRTGAVQRLIESLQVSSWTQVLGDSVTRALLAWYNVPNLQEWKRCVSTVSNIKDFRTNRRMRVGGYGVLPTVAEGGTYQPLTSPADEEATFAVSKKGGNEDLTIEMIANDDVGALKLIPQRLGRAAARTLYKGVFDILRTNPTTTYDSTALFHADHSNLGSTALSQAAISATRKALREMVGYGDTEEVLALDINCICVPAELEELAFQLTRSAVAIGAGTYSAEPNINQGRFDYCVVPYWTDATDWVACANPADVPTIEVGFLNGQQEPEILVQDQPTVGSVFTADKITYRIRHIWGTAVLDHRGLYKHVVAG